MATAKVHVAVDAYHDTEGNVRPRIIYHDKQRYQISQTFGPVPAVGFNGGQAWRLDVHIGFKATQLYYEFDEKGKLHWWVELKQHPFAED